MNKIYIKNYKEGLRINEMLLVVGVSKGITNAGATYLNIEFQDKTGLIDAKLWDANEFDIETVVSGAVLNVEGDVLLYRNNLQLRVNRIYTVNKSEYDVDEFLKSAPISKEKLKREIAAYIAEIDNEILHKLVSLIIDENSEDYFTFPAASRIHHEYVGGLASHVLGMLKIAKNIVEQHQFINKSLLYSGIILHDFGKIEELSGPILTHYTTAGRLLGHISLMQANLLDYAKRLEVADSEEVMLLRHLILSHHGQYEYGSPVLPMVLEAELLSIIDNLDARINMLEKALDQSEVGEFTSRIFSLENRSFYKSKL